ncbi:polynucleotide 3'-phosphatase ZDP [Quillaja saponaria]|uniref:Polynucleotide 3'-phosphatase ZDP n=1 Tax=Quillaja saponaria TaxID=32244 RepID=A0AAD7LGB2_QUISA|nr:polynucleotide 3'-phosphatase ZDP [Quillaja saponaria]
MPATSSSQIVAEYAKSNRSTCTKCSATIASNSLRLGLVTRDPRGFNKTKWHHLDCFPIGSETIVSAQAIKGFSSLKSSDQESLEKLVDGDDKTQKKESDEYKSLNEGSDIRIVDEDAEYKQDERDSKERKESDIPLKCDYLEIVIHDSYPHLQAIALPRPAVFMMTVFFVSFDKYDPGLLSPARK